MELHGLIHGHGKVGTIFLFILRVGLFEMVGAV